MKRFLAAAMLAASLNLGLAVPALAQNIDLTRTIPTPTEIGNLPTGFRSVSQIVAEIFRIVIAISGAIFLVLLLVGGVQYLTGAGNEETTGKAKRLMIDAVVGLILVLAAYSIGTFILRRVGFTGLPAGAGSSPPVNNNAPIGGGGGSVNGDPIGSPTNPSND